MSMRLRAALAATLALAGQPVFAQQWPAEPVRIDIAAQPIADALNEWARQTGFQLLLPEEGLADGVIAPNVVGTLAPRAALERLLAGSGLTYEHTADRAIIVRPAGQANGTTTGNSNIIEEVNVVGVIDFQQNDAFGATKMGMPVAETPFSMLVVTNDLMRTASVKKTSDLYKLDPSGGTNNRMGGYGRAFARGYAVPVYMDGFRQSVEADLDYAAFDRMELVKGGTSTLYGQNEPGGVLNYVSKVPQTTSAIQLKAEAGTDSFYRGELDVTGPIFDSDRWSWRAIFAQQKDDTYQDFGQDDSYAAISSLMYRGERATFLLRAHFEEQEMKYSNGLAVQLDAPIPTGYTWDSAVRAGLIGLKLVDDVPRSRAFGPQSQRKKIFLTQAQFDYRFESNWKLRTNVQSSRGDDFINLTLVQGPLDFDGRNRIQYQSPGRLKDEDYSLEVNLFGDFQLLGRTHTLFFGVDYSNSTTVGWTGTANLYTTYETSTFNIFNPNYSAFVISPIDNTGPYGYQRKNIYSGLTVQAVFNPMERLKVLVGGRLSSDQDGANFFGYAAQPNVATALALAENAEGTYQLNANTAFTKQLGVTYELVKGVNAYASYSESYVPTSARRYEPGATSGSRIDPPQGVNYELGLKGDVGKNFGFSATLFQIEQDIIVGDPAHLGFSIPVGGRRNRGVELSMQGNVTDGLSIYAAAAYQNPEYLEGRFKGMKSATAAKIGLSLFATYELLGGPLKGLGFGSGVVHKGDRKGGDLLNDLRLTATGEQYEFNWGDYTEVDARVFYNWNDWQVYGAVTNLLDEKYYTPAFDWLALVQNANPGRTFRLGMSVKL